MAALAVLLLVGWAAHNAAENLARRNIDFSFAFLAHPAGFDIPFHLAEWSPADTYGRALLVSGLNTLLAAALAILGATVLGLVLGLMRLSGNPLASGLARGLVELIRNTPQLLQIVFLYVAVLQVLPGTRQSLALGAGVFLNVRGLFLPAPLSPAFFWIAGIALLLALGLPPLARRLSPDHAARLPWPLLSPALILAGLVAGGLATGWERPELHGFNFAGGWRLPPELLALSVGISVYTSAFVAENVRASILAVPGGQREAALSLGLSPARTMRLVVLPQALRTLVPPLTSQYLNVIKSTTLGAAIAYPEILQIFARTVLNQSGRAIEVMTLVLSVFLVVNLVVSWVMNLWNRRLALQGR